MGGVSKDGECQGNKRRHYIYYKDKEKEQREGQQRWIGLEYFCLGAGKRGQFGNEKFEEWKKG